MVVPGYKMIHWEHIPANYDTCIGAINLFAGAKVNSETGRLNGFYFRWKVEVSTIKGQLIGCIAEDSYTLKQPLSNVTNEDMLAVMQLSFKKFKKDFDSRVDLLGYQYIALEFAGSLQIAEDFLDELSFRR